MPAQRLFTDKQDHEITRLYISGVPTYKLAEQYNCATLTIKRSILRCGEKIRSRNKLNDNEQKDVADLHLNGMSVGKIAEKLDICTSVVWSAINKYLTKEQRKARKFKVTDKDQIDFILKEYDSGKARTTIAHEFGTWPCVINNVLKRHGRIIEDRLRKREKHPWFKNGRVKTKDGYVWILIGRTGHWLSDYTYKNGYIAEHRLIMAEYLKRPLRKNETVHHINGVKDDNRIENLQLLDKNHGKGIVQKCKDCGSQNIITVPINDMC